MCGDELLHPAPGGVAGAARGLGRGALQQRRALFGVEGHQAREERPQRGGARLALEPRGLGAELRTRDRLQPGGDVARRPEALERRERRERANELRLVVDVAVAPARSVERDPLGVLARPAGACLLLVRVRLDRERLAGRQHLEQERQLVAEAVAHVGAEQRDRVVLDRAVERAHPARLGDPRRGLRVRADPQLGLGLGRRRLAAEQLRDRRARAPGVVLDRVVEDQDGRAHRNGTTISVEPGAVETRYGAGGGAASSAALSSFNFPCTMRTLRGPVRRNCFCAAESASSAGSS